MDDSYLFNLDGEVKGQVSKRRRADGGMSMNSKEKQARASGAREIGRGACDTRALTNGGGPRH